MNDIRLIIVIVSFLLWNSTDGVGSPHFVRGCDSGESAFAIMSGLKSAESSKGNHLGGAIHKGSWQDRSKLALAYLHAGMTEEEIALADRVTAVAKLNVRDKNGETPLTKAAKAGDVDVVESLISGGANLNLKDGHGKTGLMVALESGNVAVADKLIANSVNLNLKGEGGKTALMVAVKCRASTVKLLIDANAKLDLKDDAGKGWQDGTDVSGRGWTRRNCKKSGKSC
ncbi:MAG: ankyrin repeat domain-containing protein [Alphaproteobacteria bacterium]|nr:MAG: ankyrin repeat domain-containing protein [Alphaproteobacteria bacterium]